MRVKVWAFDPATDELTEMAEWPDGWPIPAIGEHIGYVIPEPKQWAVTDVFWLPDDDEDTAAWVTVVPSEPGEGPR